MDARARRNLNQLNTELQDVQKIMVQNIDDVLQRGLAISGKFALLLLGLNANELMLLIVLNRIGQQSEQFVSSVPEVQEGRALSQHPGHLRQGGRCRRHCPRLYPLLLGYLGLL